MEDVVLSALENDDRNQFVLDNQEAFRFGAMEEFGLQDDHLEEDEEIISRETIEQSIDGGTAYRILFNGEKVGGLVLRTEGIHGDLELLFISPAYHSKGIGQKAWKQVESMYPNIKIWETCTPYFEKRNIHFYVNRCGFHVVEFFNKYHKDPHDVFETDDDEFEGMFRFEKRID